MIPRPHTSKLFPYTTLFRSKKLEKNNWGSGRIKIPSSHGHGVITAGDNNNAINNNEAKSDRDETVFGVVIGLVIAGCGQEAVNRPYTLQDAQSNTLFTAFTQRSPKYLDPARSYSTDETPFTYSIYEPLYSYHYLKRPYELIPRAAQEVVEPYFLDE